MGNVVVSIHQPNFMPWLGYFYKIKSSDIFIFLDDVQFQKTGASYTNRVSLNIQGKSSYITIPVKRESGVWNINKTHFLNTKWKKKLIGTLQANYAKTPFFKENKDFIFDLIEYEASNLAEYNINFIKAIIKKLNFKTKIKKSSDFNINSVSTQRLIDLIQKVGGNTYLSGNGGDNYQDHNLYKENKIELKYNKVPNFKYNQCNVKEFIGGLSIVDAIFNIGFQALKEEYFNENSQYSI